MQDCTTYHSIILIKSTITILKPISVLIFTWWLVSHTLHIVSCVRAHTRLVLGPCLRAQASAHTRTLHTRTITASGAVFRGHQQTTIEWSWSETRKYFLKIPTDLTWDPMLGMTIDSSSGLSTFCSYSDPRQGSTWSGKKIFWKWFILILSIFAWR